MKLTVGVCDDCAEQVQLLKRYLESCQDDDDLDIITATEPQRFLEMTRNERPRLVFLDIDMEGLNGIELGGKIKENDADAIIVYVTAHEKYALEAFRVRAFHYLIKPITKEKVAAVLAEALAFIGKSGGGEPENTFALQRRGETITLPMRSIVCFEKLGHKIRVHTTAGCEEYYSNFTQLMMQIGHGDFIQCHQGYIVNVGKIRAFRDKTLFMENGLQVPVSRTFAEEVREALAKRLFAGKDGV